ncbi:MAG: TlpA disulfide reductase family protein [bacterium]|nr:TlpA disulfide reductase family protein [bacterium]
MKRMLIGFTVLLVAVTMTATAFSAGEDQKEVFGSKVGDKLAPFTLADPTTSKSYSFKDLAEGGKDVAIVFMQSACTLCVAEINDFVAAEDDLKGKLNVVLVSVDFDGARLIPYKEAYRISFPILHDREAKVMESVDFHASPAMVLVGANGIIKKKVNGYDRAEVKGMVKEYSK